MNIAINSDFLCSSGSPEPFLRLIAEAGFTHLHWCHQWNTDFIYTAPEIAAYREMLRKYGIKLLDIHGSSGIEKCWWSEVDYCRRAGVELVLNRIRMFCELEGEGTVMMHIPCFKIGQEIPAVEKTHFEALKRSIDELLPSLEKYNVMIAVENMFDDSFETIALLMNEYPAEYIGITYDSGHGNINSARGADFMEKWKHRLQALHLNDNNGSGDQHQPPFYGTVDWEKAAKMIASSSYSDRPVSFELAVRCTPFMKDGLDAGDEDALRNFLADACKRCSIVAGMVENCRNLS